MTTPAPDDSGDAPTPAPPPAPPPTANQHRESVQASKLLKKLVKAWGLNEGAVRALAMLDDPEDVHKLHGMVNSVPEIKKLHSHLKEYGADGWLEDNYPKGTPATRSGTALGLAEAELPANMLADAGRPIDKLPPTPQPHQAPLQPSPPRDPQGVITASASSSQSAEATLPTSAPTSQGTSPTWKPNKRPKRYHDPATQGEPQKEFHCPSCHKKYTRLPWFESHFAEHIQKWFGANFGEYHLFGCGYCPSVLANYPGGDVHAASASQGWNAIVAHVSHKHSRYQENTVDWLVDAAIRNVLWHDKFRRRWLQFLTGIPADPLSSTYLSWDAPEKKQANWQLLSALQEAGATNRPEYVPGQQYPDHVHRLMQQAYDLADKHTQPLIPTYSGETTTALPTGDPGSITYGMGNQAGNQGWGTMPLPGPALHRPLGSHMGFGQNPPYYNQLPPDNTE